MERIDLSPTLSMSRLVYGLWRLGDGDDSSPATVRAKIDACLDQGITTMDNADIYGGYMVEEILGAAMDSSLRDRIEIVTKCDIVAPVGRYEDAPVKYYDTSRAHLRASVENSLRLMKTDRIDLLLIHRPDPLMDHEETGAALDELVSEGKVLNVGVSNFRPWDWDLLQSGMKNAICTNQIELSLSAHEGFVNGDVARHQKDRTPIMAWSPLGGGALMTGSGEVQTVLAELAEAYGVDTAAIAVAWLLAHPARILPVLGTNSMARIAKLSDAMSVNMSRVDWYKLYTAALGREVA